MKNITIIAAFAAILIAGCTPKEDAAGNDTQTPATSGGAAQTAAYAYDQGSKKVGDKGICVVCSVRDGKVGEEEDVKETLNYNGKTYVFCNESEKADFIADPKKYVGQ